MKIDSGALIEKVRKHEYLYDSSHALYKNVARNAEAWNQIAEELNVASNVAKTKWKNLRDCYLRYKKGTRGGAGVVKKYVKWPWSTHMKFLDDTLQKRPRINKRPTPMKTEDSTSPTTEITPLIDVTDIIDSNENQLSTTSSKMPVHENEVDEVIEFLRSKPRKRDLDDIDHLFLSYADTFRKFQPMTQAMMKIELATLFARTELKELGTPLQSTQLFSSSSATELH